MNPDNRSHPTQTTRLMLAGQKIGLQVVLSEAGTIAQIDAGFAALVQERAHAVIFFGDTFFSQHLQELARGALKHRLPSIYIVREYADTGGLMSYGAPITENFRRAGRYVDKILKGAKPADLPFEQPTNYRLFVNVKTAKALGLVVPQSLLQRADGVIE
jgi:putative ABC transport system substrate-binding protein